MCSRVMRSGIDRCAKARPAISAYADTSDAVAASLTVTPDGGSRGGRPPAHTISGVCAHSVKPRGTSSATRSSSTPTRANTQPVLPWSSNRSVTVSAHSGAARTWSDRTAVRDEGQSEEPISATTPRSSNTPPPRSSCAVNRVKSHRLRCARSSSGLTTPTLPATWYSHPSKSNAEDLRSRLTNRSRGVSEVMGPGPPEEVHKHADQGRRGQRAAPAQDRGHRRDQAAVRRRRRRRAHGIPRADRHRDRQPAGLVAPGGDRLQGLQEHARTPGRDR